MKNKFIKQGLLSAAIAVAYIGLVSLFLSNANRILGNVNGPLGSVLFLMLLVFSAAFMGVVIFGRPVMIYIDGQKKEALFLLGSTLGFFFLIGIILGLVLVPTF